MNSILTGILILSIFSYRNVYAGLSQILHDLGVVDADALAAVATAAAESTTPSPSRAISPGGFFPFENYGCFCHFGDGLTSGFGKPLDGIDTGCKELRSAYQCVQIEEGDTCVPWEVDDVSFLGTSNHYIAAVAFFDDLEDVQDRCALFNPLDTCKKLACLVEGFFVLKVVAAIRNQAFSTSNFVASGFDRDTCKINTGSGTNTGPIQCCGSYPEKTPYFTNNGLRGCCGSQTFNTVIYECCNGDTVQNSC